MRLKKILLRVRSFLRVRTFVWLYLNVRRLKRNNFVTLFGLEGNLKINLPKINYLDLLSKSGRDFSLRCVTYSTRPTKEALLRKTVYHLFECGYISAENSVIDIGCWLADNTVIWAKLLKGGNIFAIDPSRENLEFGKRVATLNNVQNINWIQAICSDKPNVPLTILDGDINHAKFADLNQISCAIGYRTTTLDEIVPKASHDKISLLHVDVEGFEEKVILGASEIIAKSKPVVIFEQHISAEDPLPIVDFLRHQQYDIYMINEVLPGCAYDCRNFIALRSDKPFPPIPMAKQYDGRTEGIWYAALGYPLLKVE